MATINFSPGCHPWNPGDPTTHPPIDATFLEAIAKQGYVPFTGPAGMFGGKSETRSIVVIHRGRGKKWELIFREQDHDVVSTMTTDLPKATSSVLAWLNGKPLLVEPDSLREAA